MSDAQGNGTTGEAAVPEDGTAAGLFDLVKTGRRTTTVDISRGETKKRYHLAEMPASLFATCNMMAHVEHREDGNSVFDAHRFKTLQIIASLDGPSAIPGATFDEKVAHLIQTEKGP
ncbi:MAG: hypothetical protein KAJ37_11840, partial [Candidatus Krumholzibacteria bacterium]|nr:hypothetical protein [Candidatus Krumholzibacteria bacterium]